MSEQQPGNGRPPDGRDNTSEPFVLGEQIAKAAAAEKRRKAGGDTGTSPVPGEGYDHRDDELGLLRPRPAPLDSALAGLTREYAKADEQTRAAIRRSISMQEFYNLLTFGRRAAVFALRERGAARVTEGLTAVAMIEAERVDWRDILVALSLLNHAAERVGADADRLFREAGRLAEPEVAQLIDGFVRRSPAEKNLRSSWGYEEVEVGGRVGLIGWGFRPWHPTRDLPKAAIEIADFLAGDQYRPDSVEIATELPAVWLRTNDDPAPGKAMKEIRALRDDPCRPSPRRMPGPEQPDVRRLPRRDGRRIVRPDASGVVAGEEAGKLRHARRGGEEPVLSHRRPVMGRGRGVV